MTTEEANRNRRSRLQERQALHQIVEVEGGRKKRKKEWEVRMERRDGRQTAQQQHRSSNVMDFVYMHPDIAMR